MSGATINESLVRHIAHLSRLTLSDDEVAVMSRELSEIVAYVHQLAEPNTDDVEPTAHAIDVKNVFRDDQVGDSLDPDRSLANAPQRQDAFFKVPKVLDTEGGA